MGYHVIIDPGSPLIESVYVERYSDLVKVEGLTERSVIYEADARAVPEKVGHSVHYRNLAQPWYRAGLRAQAMFARMARRRGLVLKELHQDPFSFRAYAEGIGMPVKRGDFLIRNLHNLEVEVKCRTFHGSGTERYFYFPADDLQKHVNMQLSTQTPVVVAVFRRKEDGPVRESLCMIRVDRIRELAEVSAVEQGEYGAVYRIPVKETLPGFDLLQQYGIGRIDLRLREKQATGYGKTKNMPEEKPAYVLVAYYKNQAHLQWIISRGRYNVRMGNARGALRLGVEEAGARYILLHGPGERTTGKLLKILEEGPRVFSRDTLIRNGYPVVPAHDFYLVYRVVPAYEKELTGRVWDISVLEGYRAGRGSALPFAVKLEELLKK